MTREIRGLRQTLCRTVWSALFLILAILTGCNNSNNDSSSSSAPFFDPKAFHYLKASNTDQFDFFGLAVAISGDGSTLAVGAGGEASSASGVNGDEDNNTAQDAGAVYVFTRSADSDWTQQAYLKGSNPGVGYKLFSVALSADGSTLAMGAYDEANSARGINNPNTPDASAPLAGAVYVFTRSGDGTWTQQAYVKASNADAGDQFGWSLALSADGDTLVVGAKQEASNATGIDGDQIDNSSPYAGAVYVFTRSAGVWTQQAFIKASNTEPSNAGAVGDNFGWSLALSADGGTLAVGALNEASSSFGVNGNQADNSAFGTGAVYVFTRSGTTWTQQAYVKASNPDPGDAFGYSVALNKDGTTLAVGAIGEASQDPRVNGIQADNGAPETGAVYVFTRLGAIWTMRAYVKAFNNALLLTEPFDHFGQSVALNVDGTILAVGSPGESSNATGINGNQIDRSAPGSGAVYVFTGEGDTWTLKAYVKATNTVAGATFGYSLALDADGTALAVGATGEASSATGIDGDQTINCAVNVNCATNAGAVYVY